MSEPTIEQYGILAVVVWIFVKDILPMLISLVGKLADLIIPAKTKEKQLSIQRAAELEERKADLEERQVIALEQIGTSLVVIKMRQDELDKDLSEMKDTQNRHLSLLSSSLVTANQSLAVILERIGHQEQPK